MHRFRKLLCTVWGLISSCPFKLFSYFVCLHGCASFVYCICTRCLVFSARCVENSKNPKVRLFGVVFFFRVWKFSVLLLFLYSLFFFRRLRTHPPLVWLCPLRCIRFLLLVGCIVNTTFNTSTYFFVSLLLYLSCVGCFCFSFLLYCLEGLDREAAGLVREKGGRAGFVR